MKTLTQKIFIFFLVALNACFYSQISLASANKCVILLHGLGRTHLSMSFLGASLKKQGYMVVNQSYPSTSKSVDFIANNSIQPMVEKCLTKYHATSIIFITHSLGGIILQNYLTNHKLSQLTHIVMLSPPNHGSPIVDKLNNLWLFKLLLGPAGQSLVTSEQKYILNKNRQYQVMVIAGNVAGPLVTAWAFDMQNDGKVSVASAYMQGLDKFIVLPVSHTFMMNNKVARENIVNFLNKA